MESPSKPSLIDRIAALLLREPEDREDLLALLHAALDRDLLDADALSVIKGALQMSDMQVRDVMVPRAQMDCVSLERSVEEIAGMAVDQGHSRFPVIGEDKDDVLGILLAKDLLRYFAGRELDLRSMLRPAVFIPETKRLNVLLREFRVSHNHMAIVVDEYGGVAGLVTIEDVLEQIVGDIEDEHDRQQDSFIKKLSENDYLIKALTPIEDFNEYFNASLSEEEFDTIGGIVMRTFGHLPRRNEIAEVGGFQFKVLNADSRQIHLLRLNLQPGNAGR